VILYTNGDIMAICKGDGCKKHANYNFKELKAEYCKNCSRPDMIDVNTSKCIKCERIKSSFNFKGLKAEYCKKCSSPDMINVNNPKCIKCKLITPLYNFKGLKAEYCKGCSSLDMIDVNTSKCIKCKLIQPTYNLKGLKAEYCKNCSSPDMIDVRSPKCIKCELIRSCYNFKGLKAEYCKKCSSPDMIDVVSTKCIKCERIKPSFNFKGLKAEYCKNCSSPDMIDVNNPKCIKCELLIPSYNFKGLKAKYCKGCSSPDMIDVVSSNCIILYCDKIQVIDKYCWACYYNINPINKPKRIKVKEEEVSNFIKASFPELNIIYDKSLIGDIGCIKARPDVLINLNKHSIIIECDEHQHSYYKDTCKELIRIPKMQQELNRNLIVIRFNPDGYIDNNKNKIVSCFAIDPRVGMNVIKKDQLKNWNNRLETLKDCLNDAINNEPTKIISEIKLFFDSI